MTIDRVQKLKDARTEASKEIDDYKKAKEEEFKKFESSVSYMAIYHTSLVSNPTSSTPATPQMHKRQLTKTRMLN